MSRELLDECIEMLTRRHCSTLWAAMPDGHMVGHLKHIGAYPLDQVFVDRLTKGET